MALATSPVIVPLKGGLTITLDALRWLLSAEERGLRFQLLEDGRLWVGPKAAIAPADDQFIQEHRDELRAAVRYCAEVTA